MQPYRVAVLGAGTVGRAVIERLLADGEFLAARAGGRRVELAAVAARSRGRLDGLDLPTVTVVASDPLALLERTDLDAVVELMGGLEPSGTVVRQALARRTDVVTANKALLAEAGAELEALSRTSGASLRFEPAVAGGTPLLALLAEDLVGMRIDRLRGVINGTTNWILDAMERDGLSAADALAAAQAAGYAEADPTLDTEAHDPAQKLVILARLAFGTWIRTTQVRRTADAPPGAGGSGIAKVSRQEVAAAAQAGRRIRLVAEVMLRDGRLSASVHPRSLPADDALARARGVTNVVEIEGAPHGRVVVSGPGAGGVQTAAAVIADLLRLAQGAGSTWAGLPPAGGAAIGQDEQAADR